MMRTRRFVLLICTVLCWIAFSSGRVLGQEIAIYSFTGQADGNGPAAGLISDQAGNLYGTAPIGGNEQGQCQSLGGCGVVFELSPNTNGTWTEATIHTFVGGTDGIQPHGNLIIDGSGNLYGTTIYGGNGCAGYYSCGTVYELSPVGNGLWNETILYAFKGGTDGDGPEAGMISDSAGNLYGTTAFGANSACNSLGCGTVFQLSKGQDGSWTEQVLYIFQDGADGAEPGTALVFDSSGNLYGAAPIGGDVSCNPPYGCGVIYQLSPSSASWTENVLYTFNCNKSPKGCFPSAGLAIDDTGNLYGTSEGGGAHRYGFVFMLSPEMNGMWNATLLHSFDLTHGGQPRGSLTLDKAGNLYGTTNLGGQSNHLCESGCGTVFRLMRNGDGFVYDFAGFGGGLRGANPQSNVIIDQAGNLYGTTAGGGLYGAGTVFKVTP